MYSVFIFSEILDHKPSNLFILKNHSLDFGFSFKHWHVAKDPWPLQESPAQFQSYHLRALFSQQNNPTVACSLPNNNFPEPRTWY